LQQRPNRNLQRLRNPHELHQVEIRITRLNLDNCSFRQAATLREMRARQLETQSPSTHGCTQSAHERN
jgi:hypothetical protein